MIEKGEAVSNEKFRSSQNGCGSRQSALGPAGSKSLHVAEIGRHDFDAGRASIAIDILTTLRSKRSERESLLRSH